MGPSLLGLEFRVGRQLHGLDCLLCIETEGSTLALYSPLSTAGLPPHTHTKMSLDLNGTKVI